MPNIPINFVAEAEPSSGGLGAFGLDIKLFLAQLATFAIVLIVLAKFVFPRLSATLEKRRLALEESLKQAKQTEEALEKAELKVQEMIKKARADANDALKEAEKQATQVIAEAEQRGAGRAEQIISEAKKQLDIERQKLREELQSELAGLVSEATKVILSQKIDSKKDQALVRDAVERISR